MRVPENLPEIAAPVEEWNKTFRDADNTIFLLSSRLPVGNMSFQVLPARMSNAARGFSRPMQKVTKNGKHLSRKLLDLRWFW